MTSRYFYAIRSALNSTFPLLPRIRRSFWGLLLFSVLMFTIMIANDPWPVQVVPVTGGSVEQKVVASYDQSSVVLGGRLLINHPDLFERLLLTNAALNFNALTLLFLAGISIVVLVMTRGLSADKPAFEKDISPHIRLIAYLMLAHAVASAGSYFYYSNAHVRYLTHSEFAVPATFPIMSMAEAYAALMVLAIANWYKQGVALKAEQQLTI